MKFGIVFGALILVAGFIFADDEGIKLTVGYWDFEPEEIEFGFDVSGDVGYSIPLNFNDKPAYRDIGEHYDAVAPAFNVRAGLGLSAQKEGNPLARSTYALEFSHRAFTGDTVDLSLYGFAISNRSSIFPAKHFSVITGSSGGFFFLDADPEITTTNTFADYTADINARTGKLHYYHTNEMGIGVSFGRNSTIELSAGGRFETYYPRYLLWKEMARNITSQAVSSTISLIADETDIWALNLVGDVAVILMEMFNLNFYPDAVGLTHQHIITPSASLTIRF
ncbi:MAG TPA: hypothetical protein ENN07_06440 [candidate division Zixibacteria bacterium]|nr:hypothetical protein [candidate division Zixibacteria bacterium]